MNETANDILMGAAVPYVKLTEGVSVSGKIVKISEPYQERDFDPSGNNQGAPKFYNSGSPIMSFFIDIASNVRDASRPDDDGVRRIFMDGKRIKDAVRSAIKTAGAQGLNAGATLTITCTHYDTPGDVRSGKNYQVQYIPGAAANDVLMQQPQPAQSQPQPAPPMAQPQAVPQPAQQVTAPQPVTQPAPAAPQWTPEQIAAMQAAGLDLSALAR